MESNRGQIVVQFLVENLILRTIALLLGVSIAEFLLVPAFNDLVYAEILQIRYFHDWGLLGFLGGILWLTAMGAGAYPAWYIASFKPNLIFKGKQKLGDQNPLTRILLSLQYTFSFVSIIVGIAVFENTTLQQQKDWGYQQHDVVSLPLEADNYRLMRQSLAEIPEALAWAGAGKDGHIGLSAVNGYVTDPQGNFVAVKAFQIGEGYEALMGLKLLQGNFLPHSMGKDQLKVLVNETYVKTFGLENPMGERILFNE
jgi:hypothetical protein